MTRVCTRFIADLSVEDQEFLVVSWRTHSAHAVRVRSHAILLSAKGISVPQLTEIFSVDDNTVRSWLDRWDGQGRDGLEDLPRPGGPFKLDESQRQMTIDLLHEHPNNPKVVIDQVTKRTGKSISRRTLSRWARKAGMSWKRFRKSLKKLRDPELFAQVKAELAELSQMPDVKVAYFDEATFSLTAVVPYGWQDIGTRVTIDLSGARQCVHVLGVDDESHMTSYIHSGSINGETVATVIDDYSNHIGKTTVLVLDNASPHTCKLVEQKKAGWEAKGLILYPLPTYSPELNEIEHRWKDVKYTELPIAAWQSLKSLIDGLTTTFKKLGRLGLLPSLAYG
jgi:transposase